MKSIVYKKKDRIKGIYAYCQKCKTTIGSGTCQKTKKRLSSCDYPEFHTFRASVIVPNTNGAKRKKKILNTTNLEEAIKLKFSFEQELKESSFQNHPDENINDLKPELLIHCMDLFVRYLNNEGVEEHKVKQRSKKHIDDVKRYFKFLCLALKEAKIDHTIYRVESMNDKLVGYLHKYMLEELNYQNKTYNKVMSQMRQFVDWLIKEKGYSIKNPFEGVTRKREVRDNIVITKGEFDLLISVITKENGINISPSGYRRNFYRDWLVVAFRVALETGLRREEFMSLKFSDIKSDENNEPYCINVQNYKVNRIKGVADEDIVDYKTVPITRGLSTILLGLDFQNQVNEDTYLIASDAKASRKALGELVSKAFTHYWSFTKVSKQVRLKHLRKTYLTSLVNYFGEKATIISDHADVEVLKKHYTNTEVIMKANKGFQVFSPENENL